METPFIITNYKTYETGTGAKGIALARVHEKVAKETGASLGVAVQAMDLSPVIESVNIPVFSQHIDPVVYGSHTGNILPEAVKETGAHGTLINHSERRIPMEEIVKCVERAKEVGLKTMVCAKDPEEGKEILDACNPDFIAVEPPELIGGDISVSTSQPEIISKAAELIGSDKLVVGAGVKNEEDVRIALKLGAVGILLASGVTKAEDPEAVLNGLVNGLSTSS